MAKLTLTNLYKDERNRHWIEAEIRYEQAAGEHTYHECQFCTIHPARNVACPNCLHELLNEMLTAEMAKAEDHD
jgi:hypothetical protein